MRNVLRQRHLRKPGAGAPKRRWGDQPGTPGHPLLCDAQNSPPVQPLSSREAVLPLAQGLSLLQLWVQSSADATEPMRFKR